MFGLFIGTVCLVLLFATLRRRRYYYAGFGPWSYYGGHRGHHGYQGGPWHGPPWRGGYRNHIARNVLARLDTTPGQEKAIRATLEALQHNLRDAREDLQGIRTDLAQALGGDELDEQALAAALQKQEQFVGRTRDEIVQSIRAVHETLDGRQRKQLAEWIASGLSWRELRRSDHHGWL